MRIFTGLFIFLLCGASFCFGQINDSFTVEKSQIENKKKNGEIVSYPGISYINKGNKKTSGVIKWSEGFEGTQFPPAGWNIYDLSPQSVQGWTQYTIAPIFGKASASVRYEAGVPTPPNDDWFVTPQFEVNNGDLFSFWAKGAAALFLDSLEILYSVDGGTPPSGYNKITTVRTSSLQLFQIPVSFLAGQNIHIAFHYKETNQYRTYVDSVYVETKPEKDAGVDKICNSLDSPSGKFIPSVIVSNEGYETQTIPVNVSIVSTATKAVIYNNTKNVDLAPFYNVKINFPAVDSIPAGSYSIITHVNLAGDENSLNDTLSKNIQITDVVFNNGAFINAPDLAPGGYDGSVLKDPLSIFGYNNSSSMGLRVADDFTVPDGCSWVIDGFTFYGYQTGADNAASTFTSLNYRIWKGFPNAPGSQIVFGDTSANSLVSSVWAEAYRYSEIAPGTTRPVFANTASAGVTLQSGQYWVDWQTEGTITTGAWAIPIVITGSNSTGNAIQFSGVWNAVSDSVKGLNGNYPQGLAFRINGRSINSNIPVELKSFTAELINNKVVLKWNTATETNNSGFKIERKSGNSGFKEIGFVGGNGTTAKAQSYTFTDADITGGEYSYKLKQVDYDGSVNYSKEVTVNTTSPVRYSMRQNYPNPFNPTTTITFSLTSDSKVNLKIYNMLGQQVMELINQNMVKGNHKFLLDASRLSSGVYFYRIDAVGKDGASFCDVKKMSLIK